MATPIFEPSMNKWRYRLTINGKTKTFTSSKAGMAGKREVLRKAREWEENGSCDRYKARCSAVWDKFMESTAKRLGADSEAVRVNEKIGRLYILPAIGNCRLSTLKQSDFQEIIDNAKPHSKRTEVLSKKYLKTIRSTITQFLQYAVVNEYCEPLKGTLYIPNGHPTIGKDILQPEEIRRLFEPSDLNYHLALCFMVVTGLRPSECLGLQWSDIGASTFVINRGVNSYNEITEGKNANAKRVIPLSPIVKGILDKQRDNTQHLFSEWVFCSHTGGVGNQMTMREQLYALGKQRGFKATPYSLRHTFVSMVKNTMPEQMIKTLVGHSVSMDTFGVYGHRVNGELKQAAEIVDLTFNNIDSELNYKSQD